MFTRKQLNEVIETTPRQLEQYLCHTNQIKELYSEKEVKKIQEYFEHQQKMTEFKVKIVLGIAVAIFAILLLFIMRVVVVNG